MATAREATFVVSVLVIFRNKQFTQIFQTYGD